MGADDGFPKIHFASPAEWERWLDDNHTVSDGAWIEMAKKGADIESVRYPEVLESALCYGWIDGRREALDEWYFLQRFTPRRPLLLPAVAGLRVATADPRPGTSVREDRRPAPLLGVDVGERLGERPLVARRVFGRVLALAVGKVPRLLQYPRAVRARSLAVGLGILHANHHRLRHLARPRRSALAAHVAEDHRAIADGELRAMVLADLQALDEPERGAQPLDRLAHVRVDQDGNNGSCRD